MVQQCHCVSCFFHDGRLGNSQAASVQSLTWVWVGGTFVPTRTQNFHHFLKLALTKNPKKRPTAEKLLQVGGREWLWGLEAQRPRRQGPT